MEQQIKKNPEWELTNAYQRRDSLLSRTWSLTSYCLTLFSAMTTLVLVGTKLNWITAIPAGILATIPGIIGAFIWFSSLYSMRIVNSRIKVARNLFNDDSDDFKALDCQQAKRDEFIAKAGGWIFISLAIAVVVTAVMKTLL